MHNFSYLRVIIYGGHLFFQTWISAWQWSLSRILVVIAPIFSQTLVCCSWDCGYRQRRLQFWMRCRERGQIIDSKCDKCQKHITLILSAWQITSSLGLFCVAVVLFCFVLVGVGIGLQSRTSSTGGGKMSSKVEKKNRQALEHQHPVILRHQ